jgi:hypothetical protein
MAGLAVSLTGVAAAFAAPGGFLRSPFILIGGILGGSLLAVTGMRIAGVKKPKGDLLPR